MKDTALGLLLGWDPTMQTHCLLDPDGGLGVVFRIRHDEEGATLRVDNGRDFADHLLSLIESGTRQPPNPSIGLLGITGLSK